MASLRPLGSHDQCSGLNNAPTPPSQENSYLSVTSESDLIWNKDLCRCKIRIKMRQYKIKPSENEI
jgi:hypothetical protein